MYTQATVRYHTPPYSYASRLGRFFKVLMVALRWRGNEKGCPGFALGGEKRYIYILRILLSKQRQFPSPWVFLGSFHSKRRFLLSRRVVSF